MTVSIIIVNWNSKDYLRRCLVSLRAHCLTVDYEVIVVDGGSFDGCDEMVAHEFPAVRFVQCGENVGFARSNNLGATFATGNYLLILNPDTELINDALSVLLARLISLPDAGAIGCRLLNTDYTLQITSVLNFPTILNRTLDSEFLRRKLPNLPLWGTAALYRQTNTPSEVEAVSGACILMRRELFELLGGFSNCYFMYGEDLDLCFKIRQAGCKIYHIPDVTIIHHGGGSSRNSVSNFATVMMRESCYLFLRSHRGTPSAVFYRIAMGCSALVRLTLIPPLLCFGNHLVRHGTASLGKWLTVLRWSLWRSKTAAKFARA